MDHIFGILLEELHGLGCKRILQQQKKKLLDFNVSPTPHRVTSEQLERKEKEKC